jgi:hypothetical protein
LAAHSEGQDEQTGHREGIVLIHQASGAQFFNDFRLLMFQTSAAK